MAYFFDSIRAMHEEAVGSYYAADIGFATTDVPVSTVPASSVGVPSSGGAALPLHHASLKRFVQGTRALPGTLLQVLRRCIWEQCPCGVAVPRQGPSRNSPPPGPSEILPTNHSKLPCRGECPRGPGKNDATSESDDDVWTRAARRRRHRLESHDVFTPPPKQPREQDSSDKFSTSRALLAASARPSSCVSAFVAPAAVAVILPTEPMSPMQQQPNQTPAMAVSKEQRRIVLIVNPKKSRMQQKPNQTPAMADDKETAGKVEAEVAKPVKPLRNPQVGIGGKPEEPPRNPTWAVI